MDSSTVQLIKQRYQLLPQELKDAISASELPQKLKEISSKNNLLLDQANILHNEILFVLLGLEPASKFVDTIIRELNINREKALLIARDANTLVFDSVRSHLREWEESFIEEENKIAEQKYGQISSLEKLGGFSIEKTDGAEDTSDENHDVTPADRDSILSGIENPVSGNITTSPKQEVGSTVETHTDPLIDHLLGNPVTSTEQKIVNKELPKEKLETIPKKPSGPDPYREPIQ
jgi:hypothetical protein